MSLKNIVYILSFFTFLNASSQNVDSLKQVVSSPSLSDTAKIIVYINIGDYYVRTNPDSAIHYFNKGLEFSNKWLHKYPKDTLQLSNRATIYNDMGVSYYFVGEYDKVKECWYKAIDDEKIIKDYEGIATAHNNLGQIFLTKGDTRKALEEMLFAVETKKKYGITKSLSVNYSNVAYCYSLLGDVKRSIESYEEAKKYVDTSKPDQLADILSGLGLIYKKQNEYEMSLEKFKVAKDLYFKSDKEYKKAEVVNNIGTIYSAMGRYDTALLFYEKTLTFYDTLGYKKGYAMTSNNVAFCHNKLGNYQKALSILDSTIKINTELNYIDGLQYNFNIKGDILLNLGEKDSAIFYLEKSLEYSLKTEILETQFNSLIDLSNLYASLNLWNKAYEREHHARIIADSIFNSETKKATVRSEMQYSFDKEQLKNKLEQEKKDAIAKEELRRQQYFTIAIIIVVLLITVFFIILYKKFKETKEQKLLIEEVNEELNQTNEEILAQRDQIDLQKGKLEIQNKEILDSIEYAKRIQTAILPPNTLIDYYLENSFVLYKPKDIVAGDFYWVEVVGDIVFFAAADCTGHGVPGAMVSVVCHGALNRSVREYNLTKPSEILDKTRELVIDTFKKSEEQVKDGMDIALCCWNKKTNSIQYAGANNPLYILRKESNEIDIIKADKQPIGYVKDPKPFTNHSIDVKENDVIYLFTDGYADQFGGPKGKKLGYKKFRELLVDSSNKSLNEQQHFLENYIEDWMKNEEQIDDICVIGIKL